MLTCKAPAGCGNCRAPRILRGVGRDQPLVSSARSRRAKKKGRNDEETGDKPKPRRAKAPTTARVRLSSQFALPIGAPPPLREGPGTVTVPGPSLPQPSWPVALVAHRMSALDRDRRGVKLVAHVRAIGDVGQRPASKTHARDDESPASPGGNEAPGRRSKSKKIAIGDPRVAGRAAADARVGGIQAEMPVRKRRYRDPSCRRENSMKALAPFGVSQGRASRNDPRGATITGPSPNRHVGKKQRGRRILSLKDKHLGRPVAFEEMAYLPSRKPLSRSAGILAGARA